MAALAIGNVVLLPFPYSDLKVSSVRPAFVIQITSHGDAVVCMITTQGYGDRNIVTIPPAEQQLSKLNSPSVVRYTKLATVSPKNFCGILGSFSPEFTRAIQATLAYWIQS